MGGDAHNTKRAKYRTEDLILVPQKQPVQRFTSAQTAKTRPCWINVGVAPSSTVCLWQESIKTFPLKKKKAANQI